MLLALIVEIIGTIGGFDSYARNGNQQFELF